MRQRLSTLTILMVCLWSSSGKDIKPLRSMPGISNSLVNLGKMDISFHFSAPNKADGQSLTKTEYVHSASPFFIPKSEPQTEFESCPCSTIKNFKNPFLNNPADFVNKILRSNDLFSANQENLLSSMCCDSHEHEDTVFFDLTPKNNLDSLASFPSFSSPIQQPALPSFPLFLDSILPKAPLSNSLEGKPKQIEIFFFPKTMNGKNEFTKAKTLQIQKNKKPEIQFVGGKELKNDFKNYKFKSAFPNLQKKQNRADTEKKIEKALQDLKEKKELKEMQVQMNENKVKDEIITEPPILTAPTVSPSNVIPK